MYHINLVITLERLCIITDSHAASFSVKMCFDETNTIFNSKTEKVIYLKLLIAYKSKLKIKVT